MRFAILAVILAMVTLTGPVVADDQFKDVPKDHWAADYVKVVKAEGIMNGYPDATFKGDKPVTRYELAVALERMVTFVEQGLKPEAERQKAVQSGKSRVESQIAPSPQPSPSGEGARSGKAKVKSQIASPQPSRPGEGVGSGKSKVESHDSARALKEGGYISADSPLLTNRDKTVSPTELSQALASVVARLVEKTIPPPKD